MDPSIRPHPISGQSFAEVDALVVRLKKSTGFSKELETGDYRGYDALAGIALRPPPKMVIYKFGSRSVVGSYTLENKDQVVLKYYFPKTIPKQFAYGFLGSRAEKSWIAAHVFHRLGIPTPAPLYFLERKTLAGLRIHLSFLATRLADGISLEQFVKLYGQDTERLTRAAISLKNSFTIMASHRISHGDLKGSNLIINEGDVDMVSFIDLDAVKIGSSQKEWEVAWKKDRERFFANWKSQPVALGVFQDILSEI